MARIALVEKKSADLLNIYATIRMSRGAPLLAAILERYGHKVDCYVETIQRFNYEELLDYDLIGSSIITCTALPSYQMMRDLRRRGYTGRIVAGGPHPTECPEESLAAGADIVIRHEGDKTLPQLVSALENSDDLERIKGITFRRGETVQHNPDQAFLTEAELSELPFPALRSIIGHEKMEQILLTMSRGCQFGCSFCAVSAMFGCEYRYANLEWRLSQFRTLRSEYPEFWARCLVFLGDDNIYGPARGKQITIEMLERMIEEVLIPPVGLMCQMRVTDASPEIAKLMKQTNFVTACLGLESTDADTLKALKKGQTPEDIRVGLANLHDQGINTLGMTIAGTDSSNFFSFFRGIRQLRRWGLTFLQTLSLVPLPGTKLTKEMELEGRTWSKNYNLYNGLHVLPKPAKMSKFGVWMSIYFVSFWFYVLTSHGRGLAKKYLRPYWKMIGITILQGLKSPWQTLRKRR